jgi:hypothetical protein
MWTVTLLSGIYSLCTHLPAAATGSAVSVLSQAQSTVLRGRCMPLHPDTSPTGWYYSDFANAHQSWILSIAALQAAVSSAGLNLTALGVNVNMCSVAAGTNVSGQFLQVTSQFPGEGPCYPVWAPTVPYFNRSAAEPNPYQPGNIAAAWIICSSTNRC